jgi:gas vesicle protein
MDNGSNAATASGTGIGGFFWGMLIGAVVGGVAALLLAPKTGVETREMVMRRLNNMRDIVRSGKKDVEQMAEKTKEEAQS